MYLQRFCVSIFLPLLLAVALIAMPTPAMAQTYQVIHNFNGSDGYSPWAGVTLDAAGNLYGSNQLSFASFGNAYKLKHTGGGWVMSPLSSFSGLGGRYPESPVVFAPGGSLMGTTSSGGSGNCQGGCGIVYAMRAPQTPCRSVSCPWSQQAVYQFTGGSDGAFPSMGSITFDASGNLYGVASAGGTLNHGVVYELTRTNGVWTEKVLYSFAGGQDGSAPVGGLIFDAAGNLYGTTVNGGGTGCSLGAGCGTVFKLTPSGSGWTETTLYRFQTELDGIQPWAGLTLAPSGNLYGATVAGGINNAGVIFELSPSGGGWTYTVLYRFNDLDYDAAGPLSTLTLSPSGSLYGTAYGDGDYSRGAVFALTPSGGGGWTFSNLYSFTGFDDGFWPIGGVALDSSGNLFGTTSEGGPNFCDFEVTCGVIWEITP